MNFDSDGRFMPETVSDAITQKGQIFCSRDSMNNRQWRNFKGEYLRYLDLCQKQLDIHNGCVG